MAGQLRFSVVSSLPLPFRCAIRVFRDPTAIARQLLACPYLDGIPFDELEPDDGNNTEPGPAVLDVVVIDLPQ
ncbi:MAG TPA: hypothetical protein PLY87_14320 [Planctomycetaceae bacterium]|nr:hypothetical protein [Planctomycetaceae bacterium]HQZ66259.1 hypothetical protein [Planctomycetaceae bacterium]